VVLGEACPDTSLLGGRDQLALALGEVPLQIDALDALVVIEQEHNVLDHGSREFVVREIDVNHRLVGAQCRQNRRGTGVSHAVAREQEGQQRLRALDHLCEDLDRLGSLHQRRVGKVGHRDLGTIHELAHLF